MVLFNEMFFGTQNVRDFRRKKKERERFINHHYFLEGQGSEKVQHPFLLNKNEYHSLLNNSEVTINLLSEKNRGLRNNLERILVGVASAKQ